MFKVIYGLEFGDNLWVLYSEGKVLYGVFVVIFRVEKEIL